MINREVLRWLADFEISLDTQGPSGIFNDLVMMGPEDPDDPADVYHAGPYIQANPALRTHEDVMGTLMWIAQNQVWYNKAIYHTLSCRPGMIDKLRTVAYRDQMRHEDSDYKIAGNDYTQALLDNFLTHSVNPQWVA